MLRPKASRAVLTLSILAVMRQLAGNQTRFTLHDFRACQSYQTSHAKAFHSPFCTVKGFEQRRRVGIPPASFDSSRGREEREEIDSSAFPSLHKNGAVINSIYYTSNTLKRPAPVTVGCRVRGHLSIKQLIPTPPLAPSASCGGVTFPQVCSCKIPTVNSSHVIVCLYVSFWDFVGIFKFYHVFGGIFFSSSNALKKTLTF